MGERQDHAVATRLFGRHKTSDSVGELVKPDVDAADDDRTFPRVDQILGDNQVEPCHGSCAVDRDPPSVTERHRVLVPGLRFDECFEDGAKVNRLELNRKLRRPLALDIVESRIGEAYRSQRCRSARSIAA